MIADAQALTDNAEHPEKVRQNIMNVALDYLACGLDPEKANYFHSVYGSGTDRTYILLYESCYCIPCTEKSYCKSRDPACVILKPAFRLDFSAIRSARRQILPLSVQLAVPVGEDQLPMLEQCKEIVHKFNSVYGETLTEPEIILPSNKACLRLPGIDGKAKMSKSLGNCIYLSDEPEDIKKKVMSMFTDPNHLRVEDPGQVEGNPVFIYLDAFCKA